MKMLIADLREIFSLGWRERRTWRYFFQYLCRGYTDQDTWSLDYYVARKLQPVFGNFREWTENCCGGAHIKDYEEVQREINLYVASGGTDNERFQERVSNRLIEFWW